MTQMLELAEKEFKTAIVDMSEDLKEIMNIIGA